MRPAWRRELAALVGRLDDLPEGDARRLFIGQDLVFVLGRRAIGSPSPTRPAAAARSTRPGPWTPASPSPGSNSPG